MTRRSAIIQPELRRAVEALYQALRRWELHEFPAERYSTGPAHVPRFRVVAGGNWGSSSSGGGKELAGFENMLVLPDRMVTEKQVNLAMLDMLRSGESDRVLYGKLIARIQTGVSPASLVREEGGWAYPRERSIRYGMAVTALAGALGDLSADDALEALKEDMVRNQGM
jgi:hypothetical protein